MDTRQAKLNFFFFLIAFNDHHNRLILATCVFKPLYSFFLHLVMNGLTWLGKYLSSNFMSMGFFVVVSPNSAVLIQPRVLCTASPSTQKLNKNKHTGK